MDTLEIIRKAGRVYIIGNGGSYANAMHICNDLLNRGIRAYTLDPATMAATANDHGYEFVFSKWLMIVAEKGDALIALSGSGKSPNILKAIEVAESMEMQIIRVFGRDLSLGMQESEEYQLVWGHELWRNL